MFDFLDSDWFNIGLEIVFLILISYDVKKYFETKKREYIVNIVLTIGFAIWVLYPYYKSYYGWEDSQKQEMISTCKDSNDTKLCKCLDEKIFKNYVFDEYKILDKNSTEHLEFLKEAKEECEDDGWF
ncbi:hypothetical protein [Sulfurimonas sp.]|uniref:hypothetical protein n=1 Tax=Sulfurimonas sp. TaxID=2022749 RepID=UPI002AAF8AEA|nr:hypothetical protein [Sulfurimonas sp.]